MPKISIVIPVYNVEAFIKQSLDSVLNQTVHDWEAICVNDGSPDKCGKILEEYAQKDSRIKIITQKNQGVSAARNSALNVMSGNYVAFLDPDDVMHPQFLEIMLENIETTNVDIIWCNHSKIKEDDKVASFEKISNVKSTLISNHFERFSTRKKPCPAVTLWDKFYKAELFNNIRFVKDIKVGEDVVIMHSLLYRAKNVAFVDNNLIFYRLREGSLTRSEFNNQYIEEHLAFAKLLLGEFKDKDMSEAARQGLYFRLQKTLCKSCIAFPYKRAKKNKEYLHFWNTYSDVLAKLIKDGVYQPEYLDLRNRFLTFLFVRKKFKLLNWVLKI